MYMQQQNILITGANGQLGNCLRDAAAPYLNRHQFFYTDIAELDITDTAAVEHYITDNQINTIINAAAYTAVDRAEDEVEAAYRLNRDAVRNLAGAARRHNCRLVHISTDYVFAGEACHPYTVDAPRAPKSVYGRTKAEGEDAIVTSGCNATIIRTSWLYSEYGSNFVKTMMRIGAERAEVNIVCDQVGGPTYAGDLAHAILDLLSHDTIEAGTCIYHFANEGTASWYDLAVAVMEMAGLPCHVNPVLTSQYPTKASRPAYSIFDLNRIKKEIHFPIPYWRESLKLTINKLRIDKKN